MLREKAPTHLKRARTRISLDIKQSSCTRNRIRQRLRSSSTCQSACSLAPAVKNCRCAQASTPPCRTPIIWSRDSFADTLLRKSHYPPTQQHDADTRSRRPNRRPPSCPDRTSRQLKTTNSLALGRDAGTTRHVSRTTLTPLQQHAKASSLQQSSTPPH